MKEFWKKSAASLMAMSLLMGNNYAIHALDGEDPETAGGNPAEGVSEPGYTIRGLLVSGETTIGDPVTINPAEFTEQKSIGEVAPEIDGYSFGNAYITREGNSDTVASLGIESYFSDSGEEVSYRDVSNEDYVVETVFSYTPIEAENKTPETVAADDENGGAVEEGAENEIESSAIEQKDESSQTLENTKEVTPPIVDINSRKAVEKNNRKLTAFSSNGASYPVEITGWQNEKPSSIKPGKVQLNLKDEQGQSKSGTSINGKYGVVVKLSVKNSDGTTAQDFYKPYSINGYDLGNNGIFTIDFSELNSAGFKYQETESSGEIRFSEFRWNSEYSLSLEVSVITSNDNNDINNFVMPRDENKVADAIKLEDFEVQSPQLSEEGSIITYDLVEKPYKASIDVIKQTPDSTLSGNYYLVAFIEDNGNKYWFVNDAQINSSTTSIVPFPVKPFKTSWGTTSLKDPEKVNYFLFSGDKTPTLDDLNNNISSLISPDQMIGKFVFSVTKGAESAEIKLTEVADLKIQTQFNDENNQSITDVTKLPKDYRLLVKMVKDGKNYYALHEVVSTANPSSLSEPIVFKELVEKDGSIVVGDTPYYYTGNETITTQVVTGTDDLKDAVTSTSSSVVRYNENTIGGTQNSDLTKDLFSSSSTIAKSTEANAEVMTTTFTKKKNDGKPHDITVSFYEKRTDSTSTATLQPGNNMATGNDAYFFRVRLFNNGKLVAYRIEHVTAEDVAAANNTGRFTHTISADGEYQLVDDNGKDIKDGKLLYDPSMYTSDVRLYKAKSAGELPNDLAAVSEKGTDTLEGFDFWENVESKEGSGDAITKTKTDIALYKAYKKKYQVKVVITDPDPVPDSAISLNVTADHKTTNNDTLDIKNIMGSEDYRTESEADGQTVITYLIEDQTTNPVTFNWKDHTPTNTITGNETFTLHVGQQGVDEGFPLKINGEHYSVSYDTGNVEGTNIEYDNTNEVTTITHYVNLTKIVFDEAITPEEILGDAVDFGIVADTYKQTGHTETNYAVKNLDDNANSDVQGSGTGIMPFYVSNIIGHTLDIEKTNCPIELFIPEDQKSNLHHPHIDDLKNSTFSEPSEIAGTKKLTEYNLTHGEIENYVDRMIDAGKDTSRALASKTTISPVLSGNEKTVDTTQFPDGTTIYVDCTNCKDVIATSGWIINKLPNQSIVFNIPGETVSIGEFHTNVYAKAGDETPIDDVGSTTDAKDTGTSEKNRKVDRIIFDHISFNAYEAKTLSLNNASALFLAPMAEKVTQSNGAGWILAGGTVDSGSEWHFYRHSRHYKSKGDFVLSGKKKVKEGANEKPFDEFKKMAFTFKLYKCTYDEETGTLTEGTSALETALVDEEGNFSFDALHFTQTDIPDGTNTFYYVIKEANQNEIKNKVKYDAAPLYVKVVAADGGSGTISFRIFTGSKFNEWGELIAVKEDSDETVYEIGDFINSYGESGTLTLSGQKTITNKPADMDLSGFKFTVKEGNQTVATGESDTDGKISFTTIEYKEAGDHTYVISEDADTKPGVTNTKETVTVKVSVTDDGKGGLSVTKADDGEVALDAVNFTNSYGTSGKLTLSGKKSITNKPTGMDLSGFKFTVKEGENVVATGTSAEDGTITFSEIGYQEAGTHTYVVSEDADTKPGVTNTKETVTVKVSVTDDGKGGLSVTKADDGEVALDAVNFTNTYTSNSAVGFILKIDRPITQGTPVREEGVQFQVYNAEFKDISDAPVGKRMLFKKTGRDKEGSNVYEFVELGNNDTIATETVNGDTLETGSNGMIKITGISSDMKLTSVETKNLPGYASYTTNVPTPVDAVDPETSAETAYEAAKTSGHYFIDAPEETSLHVVKKYTDGNTRHPKDEIEVTLYKIVGDKEEALTTAKLNAGNEWKVSFANLPMRDDVGNLVKYQVRETKGGEGYTVSYSPSNISQLDGDHDYKEITVTNTKEEEKPKESEKPKASEGPKYEEQKRNVPNTSDNFNAFFWMSSLLVSVVTGCWAALTLHRYD